MDALPHTQPSSSPAARTPRQRRGNALSCAECRRLKLRCDRNFPCMNCVKKGCAAICPSESLTTGRGNRFILANTEVLHEKIAVLSSRVRQLEDALQEAHAYRSHERHPLLSEDLLKIKRPLEREAKNEQPQSLTQPDPEAEDVIDNLGSLAIDDHGKSNFVGQAASSWYIMQNLREDDDDDELIPLPEDMPWLSHTFPFNLTVGETAAQVRGTLSAKLPDEPKARQYIELYYRHAGWMYRPVEPDDLESTILCHVYGSQAGVDTGPIQSHRMAVIYMMLALAALLDLDLQPYSNEANFYYQLARAALAVDSVLDEPSIPAIQALVLMCHYMFFAEIYKPRWALMGLVVKLAQSIGLHRDGSRFKMADEETRKRRSLLWEIVTYDSWQSMTYGRPPSFSMLHIDAQMAHVPFMNDRGEEDASFELWKHRFVAECLSIVHDQAFGVQTPNYKVIQDLDRKVRMFYTPPSLQVPGFGGRIMDGSPPSVSLTMQRYTAFAIREMALFYMHRGFFARALQDSPEDPLGNKFSPSVLAANNSACSFIDLIQSLFTQHPRLTERLWFLFTHVFSCSVVLGSIAIKCPGIALARSALSHLEKAVILFESVTTQYALKALPVLRKLRDRAAQTILEAQADSAQSPPRSTPEAERDMKRDNEELATLGGKTRFVSRRGGANSTPSSPASNTGSGTSPQTSPVTHTHQVSSYPHPAVHGSGYSAAYPASQQHQPMQMSLSIPQTQQQNMQSLDMVNHVPQWQGFSNFPSGQMGHHTPSMDTQSAMFAQSMLSHTLPPEPWQGLPPLNYNYPGYPNTHQMAPGGPGMDQGGHMLQTLDSMVTPNMRQGMYYMGAAQAHPPPTPMSDAGGAADPAFAWDALMKSYDFNQM